MCAETKRRTLLLLASCLCAAATPVAGQSTGESLPDRELERLLELHHTERQLVRLVQVPAVVTTRAGKVVRGLDASDFVVYEDHVPQAIRHVTTEHEEPVSIAFLLDVSG
ncbi:MAG TPA: hypothetical protein VD788_04815, partial [Candidatus Polarisedimenticolaceae bacterium]|nr:hypothetical protein [Candidatus Polarisedimenticolaceae bacterium]